MAQARWKCPRCGNGRLAPQRPRRDDVRRYCLACSEGTGRLVERVAPALERQRSQRRERATEKQRRAREREQDAERRRHTFKLIDGRGETIEVDLREEVKALLRLPALGGPRGRLAKNPPKLTVYRRSGPWPTGRCWGPSRVHMSVGDGMRYEQVVELLLHELVHAKVPWAQHGLRFKKKLVAAAYERWPGLRILWRETEHAYHIDRRIWEAVRAMVAA